MSETKIRLSESVINTRQDQDLKKVIKKDWSEIKTSTSTATIIYSGL